MVTGTSLSPIRRILVPLDLNRLSEAKIPYSEAQARAFSAEMIVLHVIPGSPADAESVSLEESQAHAYLDAVTARLRSDGIEAMSVLRYGPVVQAILEEIETENIDLLIIGSNVRRGFSRLLLGNIAEELIAQAPCPVLLVRPNVADAEKSTPVRNFADDVARTGPVAPKPLGIRLVDVARIIGSVGRAGELDNDFRVMSRRRGEQQRFDRILKAMESGAPLPPVVLYKLGYGYYVLDGNHRVAAARQLGVREIEAEVTEFVPLGDHKSQRVFSQRRAFEKVTGLTRIGMLQPGNYPRLEDMIRDYAEEHGITNLHDAARQWENGVYRPVARKIRAMRLAEHCPDQRTADIYVALADFREAEAEREGTPIDWDEAINRFYAALHQA